MIIDRDRKMVRRGSLPAAASGRPGSAPALQLVARIIDALDVRGVSFVHFKSNVNLRRALTGEDDLDLLVDRRDRCAALEAFHQLQLREAAVVPHRQIPGIRHFYGLDRGTGKVVHVHLHFQLVVGHDATKNFHLPIERAMLASARRAGIMPLPAAEFESILYTLRMTLKFTLVLNPLACFDRRGVHEELDHLESQSDRATVDRLLETHLPAVTGELFDRCLRAIRPGASTVARWSARSALHRALAAYARRPRWRDGLLKWFRLAKACLRWLVRMPKEKKWLVDGGVIIALVGGDGAGKSTVLGQLEDRFRNVAATKRVHLGRPSPTCLTLAVRLLIVCDRLIRAGLSRLWPSSKATFCRPTEFLLTLRWLCKARDRYRAYAQARRCATAGAIVLCDRWPVAGLRLMEAPQLNGTNSKGPYGRLLHRFEQLEARYYRSIPPPDKLIVLRVHPNLSAARKPEEQPEWLRARSREVWEFAWDRTEAHVADASQSLPQVVSEVLGESFHAL